MPYVSGSAPTMIGSNPSCIAGEIVVTHPTDGTAIFLFGMRPAWTAAATIKRFAEDPELLKTEYLVPMYFAQSSSTCQVNAPFVRRG